MSQTGAFSTDKNRIIVESVIPLSSEQMNTLLENLQLDKDKVSVSNRHNSSLVAGIRVMLSGKIIDLSFQSLLNQLAGNDNE